MRPIIVRYFAAFRAAMGVDEIGYTLPNDVQSIADLLIWLQKENGIAASVFADGSSVHCAINNELAGQDAILNAGDIVDLFPPVSGG
jgi:sulfur-carrier protein